MGITGSCPSCGYHSRERGYNWGDGKYSSSRKQRYIPPTDARMVQPRKGICSKCGSKNLRFFEDGSGRCPNCGHEFNWDGETSRLQAEKYFCNKCGEPLEYIEEYKRWYCYKCDEYQ